MKILGNTEFYKKHRNFKKPHKSKKTNTHTHKPSKHKHKINTVTIDIEMYYEIGG